ncbi:piggyBac transposable element-derived protein 4-like [Vespula maculifrons]|uniref:PiggyBac transposable element-derived protein 4-like n=1 Tax=Vespula maculifrons TaxID=7453 RepID=A0ABD2D3J2_VESMC
MDLYKDVTGTQVFRPFSKNSSEMINIKIKRGFYQKPKMVIGYNTGKNAIDLSDYMSAYKNPLRKTIKWYRKLAC